MALPGEHACIVTLFVSLSTVNIYVCIHTYVYVPLLCFIYCALFIRLGLSSLGGLRLGDTLCCHLAVCRKTGTVNGPRRKKTVRFDHRHHQTVQQTSKDSGFDTGSSIFTSNDDPIYLNDIKVLI